MLKTKIFTKVFSDFSDCANYRRSLVDGDLGWEPPDRGRSPGSPTGSLSSPHRRGGRQPYVPLRAESPPSSYRG